ncbi:Fis family transcriptional regulator [uncultured Paraglaciecola sp.]|uniref:Fis family transcriptional regulator n=1 Tax=uncultured Paraglaciecola sp. TaxID=1765024 RepID=UPI002638B815|nr:Fis family transcriptional regulator [uncultured Paraglaciecola sp.]
MNKTVKKLDNNVVKALTVVCEMAKQEIVGFQWLTHSADYANFPASLMVTCVFDTDASLKQLLISKQDVVLRNHIQRQLLKAGILLKGNRRHVFFDSEQACQLAHNGDWKRRLAAN